MKSTIILYYYFLILYTLGLSSNHNILPITKDPAFIELTTNPASEPLFLTMSLQLQNSNNSDTDFDRIISLLNQLIDEAKAQLHTFSLTYAKSSGRCDIITNHLHEQAEYYKSRIALLHTTLNTLHDTQTDNAYTINHINKAKDFFTSFYLKEINQHLKEKEDKEQSIETIIKGIAQIDDVIDTLKSMTVTITIKPSEPQSQPQPQMALIQHGINKVIESYTVINKTPLCIPKQFRELMAKDMERTRIKLIEWLSQIRVLYETRKNELVISLEKNKREIWEPIEKRLRELINVYAIGDDKVVEEEKVIEAKSAEGSELLGKMNGLLEDNEELVKKNDDYCVLERKNYLEGRKTLMNEIEMFKGIREYFFVNYVKLTEYIQEKYKVKKKGSDLVKGLSIIS